MPITAHYDSTELASPLLDPTHGLRISLNLTPTFSYSHSGSVFIVTEASVSHYLDVHDLFASDPPGRTVLATKVMAGLAEGAVWYNLPPDQRFYAGGSGTVRGYRYQSVGPEFTTNGVPSGVPQGGTTIQVVNLELRQRVGTNLGFVVFTDGGGVSQSSRPSRAPSGSAWEPVCATTLRSVRFASTVAFPIRPAAQRRSVRDLHRPRAGVLMRRPIRIAAWSLGGAAAV